MICVHSGSSFAVFCFSFHFFFFPMSVLKYILHFAFIIITLYQEHFLMVLFILYFIDYNIAHFVISEIGIYFQ